MIKENENTKKTSKKVLQFMFSVGIPLASSVINGIY